MATVSASDLILFHTMERKLFNRLVKKLSKNAAKAKIVIALWLVLEEIGYYDLIRTIYSHPDSTVEAIFDETAVCLDSMAPNASEPRTSNETPYLASIINEPMSRRFFYYHRDFLSSRVNHFVHNICDIICNENEATEVGDSSKLNPYARPNSVGESSSSTSRDHGSARESSSSTSRDQRSMFLTFSNGYPLEKGDIIEFFTSNWGLVIEEVMMEQAEEGSNPRFGRIIFHDRSVIQKVLHGQPKAKFNVNGKHLWARVYVPRN